MIEYLKNIFKKNRKKDNLFCCQQVAEIKNENTDDWDYRPWGKFKIISEGKDFKVKHLIVTPGGKTSIQSHEGREEFWTVADGKATIIYGYDVNYLKTTEKKQGEFFHVKIGQIHRIENNDSEDLHIIEIWKGFHLSEEDIVRYKDLYGRV